LPLLSFAVTVMLPVEPAVAEVGAETRKEAAAPGMAVTEADPVMDEVTVSVAMMDWVPAVPRVKENVPVPLLNVELGGRMAAPSEEMKWTVPE
jgi:hypothetical protein